MMSRTTRDTDRPSISERRLNQWASSSSTTVVMRGLLAGIRYLRTQGSTSAAPLQTRRERRRVLDRPEGREAAQASREGYLAVLSGRLALQGLCNFTSRLIRRALGEIPTAAEPERNRRTLKICRNDWNQ